MKRENARSLEAASFIPVIFHFCKGAGLSLRGGGVLPAGGVATYGSTVTGGNTPLATKQSRRDIFHTGLLRPL
ncbi:MAG: hypothetical protein LBT00_01885 [Spirochaetaceae bacterium]|nr:hypothetical protein [Spirochaetaceae bacterium]